MEKLIFSGFIDHHHHHHVQIFRTNDAMIDNLFVYVVCVCAKEGKENN